MIKTSEILAKVGEIAKNNPDLTYQDRMWGMGFDDSDDPPCLYVYNGQPACIMGMALNELGVDLEYLESFDSIGDTIRDVVAKSDGIIENDGHVDELIAIQRHQDQELPFGIAFDYAIED